MSYNPKHALARAVRSLPRWARAAFIASLGASMAAGIGLAAAGGNASVSGTPFQVSDGQAGYIAFGGRFQHISETVYLRAEAQAQSAPVGIQLCDPSTGDAVQAGAVPSGSGWTIEWAAGQLPKTGGVCAGNGLLNSGVGISLSASGAVPNGDQLAISIGYHRHGNGFNDVSVEIRNLTANTFVTDWNASCNANPASSSTCGFTTNWPQFRTAGTGTLENPTGLSAPLVNLLERPVSVDVQAYNGTSGPLGGGFWTAEPVETTVSGTTLVAPAGLVNGGSTFKVFSGSATSPPAALGRPLRSIIGD